MHVGAAPKVASRAGEVSRCEAGNARELSRLPADEPLLLVSYRAAMPIVEFTPQAFIEPLRVGAQLPDMPVWLDPDLYVNVPLEKTYMAAWEVCPADFRYFVEHGSPPEENPTHYVS